MKISKMSVFYCFLSFLFRTPLSVAKRGYRGPKHTLTASHPEGDYALIWKMCAKSAIKKCCSDNEMIREEKIECKVFYWVTPKGRARVEGKWKSLWNFHPRLQHKTHIILVSVTFTFFTKHNKHNPWRSVHEQPHSRLFAARNGRLALPHYINSKSCSLVRTICVSDYFFHPFSPW